MKPAPFEYHRPGSLDEATALLAELGDEAKVLAGGQSLVPMLSLRLAYFDHVVDISRLTELRGVTAADGYLRVGAGTTETAVGADLDVARAVPLLTRATPLIGHFQIRNRGTLGGSVAHADPAGEYPVVALTLDAEIEAVSAAGGHRVIPAADFFTGLWSTALEPDELLVGVRFPVWGARSGFAVEEFARRSGDFAVAGAVVGVELDAAERVARAALGQLGRGSTPQRPAGAGA
ncbi:FAD binding domain-containing protein, partial [Frankia nepalensis]|uniref:FAD binding domain-containing protein n=1 Tax=Frankia nepalensis TaxID=1836974 RepID=UPI0019332355